MRLNPEQNVRNIWINGKQPKYGKPSEIVKCSRHSNASHYNITILQIKMNVTRILVNMVEHAWMKLTASGARVQATEREHGVKVT